MTVDEMVERLERLYRFTRDTRLRESQQLPYEDTVMFVIANKLQELEHTEKRLLLLLSDLREDIAGRASPEGMVPLGNRLWSRLEKQLDISLEERHELL